MFAQHFLQLQFFKKQFEAVENATDRGSDVSENIGEVEGTVFDEAVALLQRLERELINEISDSVALDVKAKSRAYRTDRYDNFRQIIAKKIILNLLLCLHSILYYFKVVCNAVFKRSCFIIGDTEWLSHVSGTNNASSRVAQCSCLAIV